MFKEGVSIINTDVLSDLAKYGQLYAVRQADGKKVVAIRTVLPEQTPVRWEIEEIAEQPLLPHWVAPVLAVTRAYATSELIRDARQGIYSNWQPGAGHQPDTTDHPVD